MPPKLLDQVRIAVRARHLSESTEQTYVSWVRRFVHFHGLRHPRELGPLEVNQFLTHLAIERSVSASTQNQAASALTFLYRRVLEVHLERSTEFVRAKQPTSLPVVMTRREVQVLTGLLAGC